MADSLGFVSGEEYFIVSFLCNEFILIFYKSNHSSEALIDIDKRPNLGS